MFVGESENAADQPALINTLQEEIRFLKFSEDSIPSDILGLSASPFVQDPWRQIDYVFKYVHEIGGRCMTIEEVYIDRDYMEDHGLFYSRSFLPYPASCRRLQFFRTSPAETEQRINELIECGRSTSKKPFRKACREFSDANYCGFSVIKPLPGCPVGRTVLRPYASESKDGRRSFDSTRNYVSHFCGIELTICGLAFQQQDTGVSACATTALWSSLQKVRDLEPVASATPAQITVLATRFSLPFGRPMPSDGLSIEQMCGAINALGLAPTLVRAVGFEQTRGHLYTAISAGFAPVLVVKQPSTENYHAVTVAGMKVGEPRTGAEIDEDVYDLSGDLKAIYMHDDRHGPYLRANINNSDDKMQLVVVNLEEKWDVTHILLPVHSKIRISLAIITQVAEEIAQAVLSFREAFLNAGTLPDSPESSKDSLVLAQPRVSFETSIVKAYLYVESVLLQTPAVSSDVENALAGKLPLPRYVGRISFSTSFAGKFDLLIDTTGTDKNLNLICLVAKTTEKYTKELFNQIGTEYGIESGLCLV